MNEEPNKILTLLVNKMLDMMLPLNEKAQIKEIL